MIDVLNWFAADRHRFLGLLLFMVVLFWGLRTLILAARGHSVEAEIF